MEKNLKNKSNQNGQSNQKPKKLRYYLDYKLLKRKIKELSKELAIKNQNKEGEKELGEVKMVSPASSYDSKGNDFPNIASSFKADFLSSFIDMVDKQLHKVYLFFVSKERELYVSINSHLHISKSYSTFELSSIKKEYDQLINISRITLELSKFSYYNIIAILKILKKFDRNFQSHFGKIERSYLKQKLNDKNSDLVYIVQLKVFTY